MISRPEPYNEEAERAVLGSLMLGRHAVDTVAGVLSSSDFFLDRHALIYRAFLTLYETGVPVDLQTLDTALRGQGSLEKIGGTAYLAELQSEVPTAANAGYYAEAVKVMGTRRAMIRAGTKIVEMGFNDQISEHELIDRATAVIFATAEGRAYQELQSIRQAMLLVWEQLNDQKGLLGLSTGFYDVDKLTGGLQPQNLIILAARPTAGKTSYALNVTAHVAEVEKRGVAFFSLEMSIGELGMRLVCGRAGVGMHHFRNGQLSEPQRARMTKAHGQLSELPVYLDETPAMSPTELRAKARRAKLSHDVGLIVVDYVQLMEPRTQESRERGVAEISRALKSLAKELNIPVLACAQLNREAERRADHRPQLSDLRDSGALEMDADVVLFIYRPRLYGENSVEDIAEIIVSKNRNGPVGTAKLRFEASQTQFMNRVEVAGNGDYVAGRRAGAVGAGGRGAG